jgi:hypothetical protein
MFAMVFLLILERWFAGQWMWVLDDRELKVMGFEGSEYS